MVGDLFFTNLSVDLVPKKKLLIDLNWNELLKIGPFLIFFTPLLHPAQQIAPLLNDLVAYHAIWLYYTQVITTI
jgi:hypothetical protein